MHNRHGAVILSEGGLRLSLTLSLILGRNLDRAELGYAGRKSTGPGPERQVN